MSYDLCPRCGGFTKKFNTLCEWCVAAVEDYKDANSLTDMIMSRGTLNIEAEQKVTNGTEKTNFLATDETQMNADFEQERAEETEPKFLTAEGA